MMRLFKNTRNSIIVLVTTLTCTSFFFIANYRTLAQDPNALRATYQSIINTYQEELKKARTEGSRVNEILVLNNAGTAYLYLGEYQKSIELLGQGLNLAREIKNRNWELNLLFNLTNAHSKLGDDYGIRFLEQQLQLTEQSGEKESRELVLRSLGLAYYQIGDYAKALDTYQKHLSIVRELKNRQEEASTLGFIAILYSLEKDYTQALNLSQQQLAIVRELGDKNREYSALLQLGSLYQYYLKDDSKALATYEQALQIAKATGMINLESSPLESMATLYASLNDAPKAIELLEKVGAIAIQNNDKLGEARVLSSLSRLYFLRKNYSKALELQKQSLAIYQANNVSTRESLANLGLILFRLGNLVEAEKTFREAIKIYDQERENVLGNSNLVTMTRDDLNIAIREWLGDMYRLLQQVLIAQNQPNTALEVAEGSRARAFIDLLTTRLSVDEKVVPKIEPPTINQMKQIAQSQNSTLVQYTVIYDDNKFLSQLKLGKQEPVETALLIWVIKPTGEIAFRRMELESLRGKLQTSLTELVRTTRESFGVVGRGLTVASRVEGSQPNNQGLQQLHQVLIEPIADLLPSDPAGRVTFIPQDALFMVPFAALQDGTGKYLIEKHTILTAPSIQVLDLTHQHASRVQELVKGALVVGNPTMPSIRPKFNSPPEQLPSLPGADREARAIASLLSTQPITGNQATKANIVQQLPNARIIHLATHGLLDNLRGVQSSIALAPAGEDNGLLTVREILNLKLNAQLAVLSACDTGRGVISGDGVIGLSRAFIGAGVPSVIVSLWSVPDAPTASLMMEFYQNWQKEPDKAQALRQAMLTVMKQYPSPRDWAAFTLIGEAD